MSTTTNYPYQLLMYSPLLYTYWYGNGFGAVTTGRSTASKPSDHDPMDQI
jgi:hypothetical protein